MHLRSPRELSYRLWQEASNLRLALAPPRLPRSFAPEWPLPGLPDGRQVAAQLRGSPFELELKSLAASILTHKIPLLGLTIDCTPPIAWRRDYTTGRETPPVYFKKLPYLDVSAAGDHKTIWELNRHQHLVLLAQHALFDPAPEPILEEIWSQLSGWIEQNPVQKGINWTSALEVGFRALSWLWIFHFVGDHIPAALRMRFLEVLYQHGCHLAVNLSFYFSPNTHLLGEALALQALGTLIPQFPGAEQWEVTGRTTLTAELRKQVQSDGSYFEQSSYYHVYALDMLLFHGILTKSSTVEFD